MKRKRLALLLAAALTVTSVDSTIMTVSAADFVSEPVVESEETEEQPAELEIPEEGTDETGGDVDVAFSDGDAAEEADDENSAEVLDGIEAEESEEVQFASEETDALAEVLSDGEEETGSVVPDEGITEIQPGTYVADIEEESGQAWFSFTPEESGRYCFYSDTNDYDTIGYFFDSREYQGTVYDYRGNSEHCNDDGGRGSNFKLAGELEAGKTYYYCAQMYDTNTGSFDVVLEKAQAVQSIHAELNTTKVTAGFSGVLNADIEYTFADGTTATGKLRPGSYWVNDDDALDGQGTGIEIQDSEGKVYYVDSTLPEGNYTVVFSVGDVKSETLNFQAVDIEDAENYYGEVKEGINPGTRTPEEDRAFYKFVPSATRRYMFSQCSSLNVYQKTEDGTFENIGMDAVLQSGTDYYISLSGRVWNSDTDEDEEYCNLKIEAHLDVSAISFTPSKTEAYDKSAHYDDRQIKGTLTLTYEDQSVWTSDPDTNFQFGYTDRYENQIVPVVTREDGEQVSLGDYDDNCLPEGTYQVYLACGEIRSEAYTLTVRSLDYDKLPRLTLGTNKVTAGKGTWYVFEPEVKGVYEDAFDTNDLKATWYYMTDDGDIYNCWFEENEYRGMDLNTDTKYLVYFENGKQSKSDEKTYTLTRVPGPTKVEVKSYKPSSMVFVKEIENATLNEITAEITFEDQTKCTVGRYEYDEYGRYLETDFARKEADGSYSDAYGQVTPGDYVWRVSYGGVYAEDIPVKVISIADVEKTELGTGTQSVQNKEGRMYFNFRPQETGRYAISFNIPVSNVALLNEENKHVSVQCEDGYTVYADLTEGVQYCLSVEAYKDHKELKVTTSLLTRPQSMKTKALKDTYIAGLEGFDADRMETEVTYPDQTVRKVRNQEETNGYYLQYKATKDNETVYNGENLTKGVWQVQPYLSASVATGSAVAVDIPAEGTEITAEKPDLSKYPALKADEWTTVKEEGKVIYTFQAAHDGTYLTEMDGAGDATFYRDGDEALQFAGRSIDLKAGDICAVVVESPSRYYEIKFRVTEEKAENPDEKPLEGNTFVLKEGTKQLVECKDSSAQITATFTPEETGYYLIWSENAGSSYVDPYVQLLQGSDELGSDDDGGSGMNFRLRSKLEKGKSYTYTMRTYGGGQFYVAFDKFQTKTIQNIEVQPKEGKNAADFSVLDDFWEFFQTKVTYTDKTSEILSWDDSRDSYDNYINRFIKSEGNAEDKEVTCKIQFSYQGIEDREYKELPVITLKRKGLAALNQLALGKSVTLPAGEDKYTSARYVFKAPEDGEYMIKLSGSQEESSRAYVYTYDRETSGGTVYLRNYTINYEADGAYSTQLEKDTWYVLDLSAWGYDKTVSAEITRTKDIKDLELVKAPDQTTILPNDVNAISLKGMQVKATYADGSTETVAYGETDSSGRYLQHNGVKWLNAEKARVYVRLGRYQVNFEVKAGSWDDVKELKVDELTQLTASKGDMITMKMTVPADDEYTVDMGQGRYIEDIKEAATAKEIVSWGNTFDLKKDTLYYIHINVTADNPTIIIRRGACNWEETVNKKATCTEDGLIVRTCKVHDHSYERTLPKLGHDAAAEWKVTKAATCGAAGEKAILCNRCGAKLQKQTIPATGQHKYSAWKTIKEATALAEGRKERTCSVCKTKQTQKIAKLKATLTLSVPAKKTLPLKLKQTYRVTVKMTKGDSVASWRSSNTKAVTVDKYGRITGKQAGKTAKITVKLRSGLTTWFNVKVQKTAVATTALKLKNASTGKYMAGSVTLKRNQKLKVTPVIAPVTSTQKVTYTTSNKKVVTVASNGQITAKAKGTAYITAKSGRKSVKIKITVK